MLMHPTVRSDMAKRLDEQEWTIIPTKGTLDTINALSDFNKTADVHKRRRFTEVRYRTNNILGVLMITGPS